MKACAAYMCGIPECLSAQFSRLLGSTLAVHPVLFEDMSMGRRCSRRRVACVNLKELAGSSLVASTGRLS
jgi:hypothetical protein